MKKLSTSILFLLFTIFAFSQRVENCDSIKSFWLLENGSINYTIKLSGKIGKTENPNVITVNGQALQFLMVNKKDFSTEGKAEKDLEILVNYVSSEANYMSGLFKTKLEVQMQKAPINNSKDALVWWYKMPEPHNEEVQNQLFVNIIIDDKIIGLASPQFNNQEFNKVRDFLMDEISSLKSVTKKKELNDLCK